MKDEEAIRKVSRPESDFLCVHEGLQVISDVVMHGCDKIVERTHGRVDRMREKLSANVEASK